MDNLTSLYSNETQIIGKDGSSRTVDGSAIMSSLLENYAREYVKGCTSPQVAMTSEFVFKNPRTGQIELSSNFTGEYKSDSITLKDEKLLVDTIYLTSLFTDETDERLTTLKEVFKRYCRNDYFYIPLMLIPIIHKSVPEEVKKTISSHANGILVRRSKGTVMRIEPQFIPGIQTKVQDAIDSGVVKLVSEIGLTDPTLVKLNEVCPQALTKDKNCAFWTMYIFKEIITNIFKKDPNEVIEEITKKPDLPALIENFKKELVTTIIPTQLEKLGYRWPDFETAFPRGGKNGKNKSRLRRTRRKQNGFSIRKTGKARASK